VLDIAASVFLVSIRIRSRPQRNITFCGNTAVVIALNDQLGQQNEQLAHDSGKLIGLINLRLLKMGCFFSVLMANVLCSQIQLILTGSGCGMCMPNIPKPI
jgi:hypothetical protein